MAKKNKNPGRGGYYGGAFEQAGECEGSGSSGRIDAEITALRIQVLQQGNVLV
ncbi:hypothetical protein Pyn_24182 [Prunus yedoensis var. nudiflora]|uniref:Uncharacterized protein n=1 Tax=Prunus yedoensis var. nudiflora TaxID=2094558 RepID=A0A314UUB1_PRUYE|nr:hypothetical protein Pyn_24182 [Prunus yedoensis var. nudiflora]